MCEAKVLTSDFLLDKIYVYIVILSYSTSTSLKRINKCLNLKFTLV